jgi:hypothetical protein
MKMLRSGDIQTFADISGQLTASIFRTKELIILSGLLLILYLQQDLHPKVRYLYFLFGIRRNHSSTLKMESYFPPKRRNTSTGLQDVTSYTPLFPNTQYDSCMRPIHRSTGLGVGVDGNPCLRAHAPMVMFMLGSRDSTAVHIK